MRRILKRVRQKDMIPLLETERLRFRAWRRGRFRRAQHAAHLRGRGASPLHRRRACERDEAWRRLAGVIGHWTLRGYGLWALEAKRDGSFVGWAGLWNPEGWPEPEVGWTLVPAAHGQGLATEAALRARAYAYHEFGMDDGGQPHLPPRSSLRRGRRTPAGARGWSGQ